MAMVLASILLRLLRSPPRRLRLSRPILSSRRMGPPPPRRRRRRCCRRSSSSPRFEEERAALIGSKGYFSRRRSPPLFLASAFRSGIIFARSSSSSSPPSSALPSMSRNGPLRLPLWLEEHLVLEDTVRPSVSSNICEPSSSSSSESNVSPLVRRRGPADRVLRPCRRPASSSSSVVVLRSPSMPLETLFRLCSDRALRRRPPSSSP
mmetsp:Transcript_27387/g.65831  ORF Transcript_27387/g.65831 Transcript_27387/m.65831 type:complete len:207 (+) Transcript_27387:918-1538(+)